MPRQEQFFSPSYLNVEPIYVAPSGGDVLAAVQRSELNLEVSKIDEQLAETLKLDDVRALSKWVSLDDTDPSCERKTFTDNIAGVEYTYTVFECLVDWATREIWESALFQGDEQIFAPHKFVVTAPGIVNITFQGKQAIENNLFKVLLQRTPSAPVVNDLN